MFHEARRAAQHARSAPSTRSRSGSTSFPWTSIVEADEQAAILGCGVGEIHAPEEIIKRHAMRIRDEAYDQAEELRMKGASREEDEERTAGEVVTAPDPNYARGWLFAESLLDEDRQARLDAMSDEEVDAELRAGGVDPERVPSAEGILAKAAALPAAGVGVVRPRYGVGVRGEAPRGGRRREARDVRRRPLGGLLPRQGRWRARAAGRGAGEGFLPAFVLAEAQPAKAEDDMGRRARAGRARHHLRRHERWGHRRHRARSGGQVYRYVVPVETAASHAPGEGCIRFVSRRWPPTAARTGRIARRSSTRQNGSILTVSTKVVVKARAAIDAWRRTTDPGEKPHLKPKPRP